MKYDDISETCFLCGLEGHMEHHHLVGGAYRSKSDKLGLVIPLCRHCHTMVHREHELMVKLRAYAESIMLRKGWTRDKWISEFGKDYIGNEMPV